MAELEALRADIAGIKTEDNEKIVQQKSRDFYWYSPVLKKRLETVTGDLVVSPKDEAELIRVLKACYKHGVPVTPRGTGTGNYGQAMPLSGGVVLSLADMNEIREIAPGRAIVEPGVICSDLDKAARFESGQEMRMHPSTAHTATVGGFIAGQFENARLLFHRHDAQTNDIAEIAQAPPARRPDTARPAGDEAG